MGILCISSDQFTQYFPVFNGISAITVGSVREEFVQVVTLQFQTTGFPTVNAI